jgi:hypothetical protein
VIPVVVGEAKQVPRLVLDDAGQRRGVLLDRHPRPVHLVAEDQRQVVVVLVADVDLLGQAEERPVQGERGVRATHVNGRVLGADVRLRGRERHVQAGEALVERGEDEVDDGRLLTGEVARGLERGDLEVVDVDGPVVGDVRRTVVIEVEHLTGEGRRVVDHEPERRGLRRHRRVEDRNREQAGVRREEQARLKGFKEELASSGADLTSRWRDD